MFDIQTVSVLIVSIGVLSGVVYYIIEVRHQSRLRQTENLIRLSPWFNMNAREMQDAITKVCSIEYENYDDYFEKYSDKQEHLMLKMLGNYFEGIGILVNKKLVDTDIVYYFWGDIIQSSWEKIKPIIGDMRKDENASNMFEFWEYLYNEMEKRDRHR
jgi:hypothetical protein